MIITETKIPGAFMIDLERKEDARGYFARAYCAETFAEHGMTTTVAQCNLSMSTEAGTLRGMHYQVAPHEEAKLVRCVRGALFDVCVDLRPDSPTFTQWAGVHLTAENRRAFFVPEGCAHGFLTLEPDTEIYYQISEAYAPDAQRGVRYNDPAFGIDWPGPIHTINERDRSYPDLDLAAFERPRYTNSQ